MGASRSNDTRPDPPRGWPTARRTFFVRAAALASDDPFDPSPTQDEALARLLEVRRIFVEPAAAALPRGQQVLARWPDAELVEIASHTAVPYGPEDVDRWVRVKTEDLVLGVKKS